MQTHISSRWWLLFAISLMALMINIDYTAVNLALVTIARDLHSNLNTIQWLLAAYVLAWVVVILPAGKASDIYGQRCFCIAGLVLFLFGSCLAGIATTSWLIIVARVLQGISCAIYTPTVYALILSNFSQKERGLAMGLVSIGVGLGMALGPTFGGVILTWLGWRWIFFVNVPIGLFALMIIVWATRHQKFVRKTERIDKVGSVVLGSALICFIFALSKIHYFEFLMWPLSLLAFSISLIFIFFLWERKCQFPLIPLGLFANRSYTGCVLAICLEQYVFSAFVVTLALYLQKVQHYSVLAASVIFLGLSLVFGVIAAFGGHWVDRIGIKRPAIIGFIGLAFGLFAFILLSYWGSLGNLIIVLAIVGASMGLAFVAIRAGLVKSIDKEKVGMRSSVFLLFSLFGNVVGVIITTIIYEVISFHELLIKIKKSVNVLLPIQTDQVRQAIEHVGVAHHDLGAFSLLIQNKILKFMPVVLNHGVNVAIFVAMIVAFFASICCYRFMENDI